MPPISYIVTAIVIALLVAASFPLTMGFSIILWYALFAAAAGLLAVFGALRIASGLHAPVWVGPVLASPAFVWAVNHLYEMTSRLNVAAFRTFDIASYLALLAAAACALQLTETASTPRAVFRPAYYVLAIAALVACLNLLAYSMGWTFTRAPAYAMTVRVVVIAGKLVKYGAFILAAMLITLRYDVERWTGIAISLVSAYLLYQSLRPLFVAGYPQGDGLTFWLQPVIMLVGAAAVWRMGSILRTSGPLRSFEAIAGHAA
jgi:hypothetical protein